MYKEEWTKLMRTGSVERRSTEYFNRDKGTEIFISLHTIDGEGWVFAETAFYPDSCPSEVERSYYASPQAKVMEMLAKNPTLRTRDLDSYPEEKWRDMRAAGKSQPACPHCGRVWD